METIRTVTAALAELRMRPSVQQVIATTKTDVEALSLLAEITLKA
jgi:hypothetical protein